MKKILISIVLSLFGLTASAQHYSTYGGVFYQGHNNHNRGWIVPVIIGGVIGYELNRSRANTVIVQQPNVLVTQQMECTPWKEIQQYDGTVTRERTCYQK